MEARLAPIVAVHLTSSDEETPPALELSPEEKVNTPPRRNLSDSSELATNNKDTEQLNDSSDSVNGSDCTDMDEDPVEKFVQEWNRLFMQHIPQTAWGLNISQIKASSYLDEPYKLFHSF